MDKRILLVALLAFAGIAIAACQTGGGIATPMPTPTLLGHAIAHQPEAVRNAP